MGALFRLLGQYEGMSQTRIATATGIAQGRVSEIIRGKRAVGASHVLSASPTAWECPTRAAGTGLAPMAALKNLAAQAATVGRPAGDRLAATDQRRSQYRRHVVGGLQKKRKPSGCSTADSAPRPSPPSSRPTWDNFRTGLHHTLTPAAASGSPLVLADAAALAGWQAIDTGRLTAAWNHFEIATAAAREADNSSLLAFAAGEQAYVLLDLGESAQALEKIRAVRGQVGNSIPHQLRCWLHAAEAEMAATAGQQEACRSALDHAAEEIGHPLSTADELPYLALNSTHLARWRGNCLVHFGDTATISDLTAALAGMDGTFTRAEAGLRCDLAAALHATGERHEARLHLGRASELAQLAGSARQRRRIADLRRRIGNAA